MDVIQQRLARMEERKPSRSSVPKRRSFLDVVRFFARRKAVEAPQQTEKFVEPLVDQQPEEKPAAKEETEEPITGLLRGALRLAKQGDPRYAVAIRTYEEQMETRLSKETWRRLNEAYRKAVVTSSDPEALFEGLGPFIGEYALSNFDSDHGELPFTPAAAMVFGGNPSLMITDIRKGTEGEPWTFDGFFTSVRVGAANGKIAGLISLEHNKLTSVTTVTLNVLGAVVARVAIIDPRADKFHDMAIAKVVSDHLEPLKQTVLACLKGETPPKPMHAPIFISMSDKTATYMRG